MPRAERAPSSRPREYFIGHSVPAENTQFAYIRIDKPLSIDQLLCLDAASHAPYGEAPQLAIPFSMANVSQDSRGVQILGFEDSPEAVHRYAKVIAKHIGRGIVHKMLYHVDTSEVVPSFVPTGEIL